jgi:hypothetical protein
MGHFLFARPHTSHISFNPHNSVRYINIFIIFNLQMESQLWSSSNWGYGLVAEHLPSMHSIPSIAKEKKEPKQPRSSIFRFLYSKHSSKDLININLFNLHKNTRRKNLLLSSFVGEELEACVKSSFLFNICHQFLSVLPSKHLSPSTQEHL